MADRKSQATLIGFSVVLTISFFILCVGWAKYFSLHIHTALAEEQTRFFEESVQQARQNPTPQGIAEYMDAIKVYYPSGSKQRTGSHLDLIVERARLQALAQLETLRSSLTNQSNANGKSVLTTNDARMEKSPAAIDQQMIQVVRDWYSSRKLEIPNNILIHEKGTNYWRLVASQNLPAEMWFDVELATKRVVRAVGD